MATSQNYKQALSAARHSLERLLDTYPDCLGTYEDESVDQVLGDAMDLLVQLDG